MPKTAETCMWTLEWSVKNETVYKTTCGNTFHFKKGGPVENLMRFCPYCGGGISQDAVGAPAGA
jgi:hypothetical protein